MTNVVLQGIKHAEAQARLLKVADHIAPREPSGRCRGPKETPDGWERCGGCWDCLYDQLREAINEVKETAVTFTELADALSTTSGRAEKEYDGGGE